MNLVWSCLLGTALLSTLACGGSTASGESADEVAARRFTAMKAGPTDPDLARMSTAAGQLDHAFLGTYRFDLAGPEHTDPLAREKRIKEVMHRYMCSFFDESIDIARSTGEKRVQTILKDVDMDDNAFDEDAKVGAFTDALTKVVANESLDVLSGTASGNNTAGEVMGVYDIAHDEILFFGFTNCGSDD